MRNWEMPLMEELMLEETACAPGCNEENPCDHEDCKLKKQGKIPTDEEEFLS